MAMQNTGKGRNTQTETLKRKSELVWRVEFCIWRARDFKLLFVFIAEICA